MLGLLPKLTEIEAGWLLWLSEPKKFDAYRASSKKKPFLALKDAKEVLFAIKKYNKDEPIDFLLDLEDKLKKYLT